MSHKKGKKLRSVLLEVLGASPVDLLKKQIIFFCSTFKVLQFFNTALIIVTLSITYSYGTYFYYVTPQLNQSMFTDGRYLYVKKVNSSQKAYFQV
jgi:hypothetical protein